MPILLKSEVHYSSIKMVDLSTSGLKSFLNFANKVSSTYMKIKLVLLFVLISTLATEQTNRDND